MKKLSKWLFPFLLLSSIPVYSFNSLEPFDPQNGYFSLEMGYDEMESHFNRSKVKGQAMLGTGLNSFLSGYLGVAIEGNKFFSNGSGGFFLGTFATLYSFNHFSLDVSLEAGLMDAFYATPGIEINYDLAPDQQFMGFYLNVNEELTGRDTDTSETGDSAKYVFTPETELNFGLYVSFFKGQQFHIRFDQRFRNNPLPNEHIYKIDALRFGYNIMIADGIQIQTELNYQIPQYNDNSRFGFRIGLVKW